MLNSTKNLVLKNFTAGLLILLISACFSFLLWYQKIFPSIKLGERSLYQIVSVEEKRIVDIKKTELKKEEVKSHVLIDYLKKPKLLQDNTNDAQSYEQLNKLTEILDLYFRGKSNLVEDRYQHFTFRQWKKIKPLINISAKEILDYGYMGSIRIENLRQINAFTKLTLEELNLLKIILENALIPNVKIDLSNLQNFEKEELSRIEPEYRLIPAKTVIINKNEIIDQEKYSILKQLNLHSHNKKFDLNEFLHGWAFSLLVFVCFFVYIFFDGMRLRFNQFLLLLVTFLAFASFVGLFAYNKPAFLPLAALSIILTLFFNSSTGYAGGFLFTLVCVFALELNFLKLLPSFSTMFAAVLFSKHATNRADLVKAGLYLSLIQMFVYSLVIIFSGHEYLNWKYLLQQGMSGLFTCVLVTFMLPFLETWFSVINRFRLRELADLEQPLLRELHEKTPGTFEHTLIVADFAQEAAKRINADHDLVRVGVLYHDIGKTVRPTIFIENQFNQENPHDSLEPIESARLIVKHVEDGLNLAKKAKLPESISIFIPTHQGTAQVGYFYKKAQEKNPQINDDRLFRYPGPAPDSRETGIVMLADTAEAAIRSMKSHDPSAVRAMVEKLIQAKIDDNQLIGSGLTKSDLEIIKETFLECWKNKNHPRIRYELNLKQNAKISNS